MTHTLYHTDDQGFHPADPDDARSWQYKAWVKSGSHIRPMVTIAPVGGSTDPNSRMSCSMHHSSMGSRGALWGTGKSTLSSYPPSRLSFKKHILPIFRNKCAPCHIPGETWTRLVTKSDFEGTPLTKIDYSNSLDLTSYEGSSVTVNNTAWTKRGIRHVTSGYQRNPESSPVLLKTKKQWNGSVIHAGGSFWSAGDSDYRALRKWISEGAQNNSPPNQKRRNKMSRKTEEIVKRNSSALWLCVFAVAICVIFGGAGDAYSAKVKTPSVSKAVWNAKKKLVTIEGRNWGKSQPVIVSNAANGEFLGSVTSGRSGSWKLKMSNMATAPCRVRAESGTKLAEKDTKNVVTCNSDTFTHVFAFNDLGMHCLDKDFSVFSILPPFNVLHAQVVRKGIAGSRPQILNDSQASVTYSAVADSSGSINTTSVSKTNFWDFVLPLYGISLPVDTGFLGFRMPGASNTPQAFSVFDPASRWFAAEGIPITPLDDQHQINSYPLMRIQAFDFASASAPPPVFVVVPVSDEMHCSSCHATGGAAANSATMQKYGIQNWSNASNTEIQYKENVLILHGAMVGIDFMARKPVLCSSCHYMLPLDLAGTGPQGDQIGNPRLSAAIHSRHGKTLNGDIPTPGDPAIIPDTGITTCYFCHPGTVTKCLRGAMGDAGIICQQCHGGLLAVSGEFKPRTPWVDLPKCQSCHTGDAVDHLGSAIRGTMVYDPADPSATPIIATNKRFAEENGKLYRFSFGHNGIACEACHGSPHAEWPVNSTVNDNIAAIQLQGHTGPIIDCTACHADGPPLSLNGPHGLHNINDANWNRNHEEFFERNSSSCKACHGLSAGRDGPLPRCSGQASRNRRTRKYHNCKGDSDFLYALPRKSAVRRLRQEWRFTSLSKESAHKKGGAC